MVAGTVPLAIRQCQMAIADFVMLCQQAQKVLYCPSKQDQSAYYFNYTLLSLYYRFRRTLTTNSLRSVTTSSSPPCIFHPRHNLDALSAGTTFCTCNHSSSCCWRSMILLTITTAPQQPKRRNSFSLC